MVSPGLENLDDNSFLALSQVLDKERSLTRKVEGPSPGGKGNRGVFGSTGDGQTPEVFDGSGALQEKEQQTQRYVQGPQEAKLDVAGWAGRALSDKGEKWAGVGTGL